MAAPDAERCVLVTGASGALGPVVVQLLQELGYRVRALGLARPEGTPFAADVEWFSGDICDGRLLDAAMKGATHAVHMAALLHINDPAPAMAAEYERVNVGGTQAVVDAAVRHGVQRLVFLSTISVYGYDRGEVLNEGSEPRPTTLYAQTKLAAERIVSSAHRADGVALATVLRLAAVYGSRVKGNYSRLVTALAAGRFVPVGRGDNRRALVQEKDVAAAIGLALEAAPAAAGEIYNVTDGQVHTLREIIDAICAALDRPSPSFSLPVWPVRVLARTGDGLAKLTGRPLPVSSTMLEKYLEDVVVDGGRIERELGFCAGYDLQNGWQDAVAGMRATGALGHARRA